MAISNPKKINNAAIMKLAQWLKSNNASPIKQAMSKTFGPDIKFKDGSQEISNMNKYFNNNKLKKGVQVNWEDPSEFLNENAAKTYSDTYKRAMDTQNLDNGVTLVDLLDSDNPQKYIIPIDSVYKLDKIELEFEDESSPMLVLAPDGST